MTEDDKLVRMSDAISAILEEKISGQQLEIMCALGTGMQAETLNQACDRHAQYIRDLPTVNAVEVPETGIGDLSDGYHTFNGLYHQRLILFAALVKAYKDRAWKSYRHEDGELCFGGGWFIVGIDTPEGSYTYHYENKDFDLFECEELPVGKHWDGHTEDDVTRLLSLAVDAVEVVRCKECDNWENDWEPIALDPQNPKYLCILCDIFTAGDWFCSRGQRREEVKE